MECDRDTFSFGNQKNARPTGNTQYTSKGPTSLFLTGIWGLEFAAIFAYMFAIPLMIGELGVWQGLVAGEILSGLPVFTWARMYHLQQNTRSREKKISTPGVECHLNR